MTAVNPASTTYQPHPPRSARTVSWAIGRGIVWLVYAFVIVAVVIATLAFFLQLLGANPNADFAAWVYRSAARVTAPFRGIFPTKPVTDQSYFDASLLFAIIMYGIFAILISEFISWLDRKREESVQHDLYEQQQAEAQAAKQVDLTTTKQTAQRPRKRTASV